MIQVVFNEASSSDLSVLPKLTQLEIVNEFQSLVQNLENLDPDRFGRLTREGQELYRFRTKEYRIYFEKTGDGVKIHRIINKNSLKDFLFRSNLPTVEDEELQKNPAFWELIDQKKPNKLA